MFNEFDQLLEDLGEGRLDQAGRRRLDELCADDPALARRFRQEQNLTGLLAHCGPNHAPAHLARSIMNRLDSRSRISWRAPWYAWIFRPAFGAALAFTVIAVIGVQSGLIIHRWRAAQQGAPAYNRAEIASVRLSSTPSRDHQVARAYPAPRTAASASQRSSAPKGRPATTAPARALPGRAGNPAAPAASTAPQTMPNLEEFPALAPASASPDPQVAIRTEEIPDPNTALGQLMMRRPVPPPTPAVPAPSVPAPRVPETDLAKPGAASADRGTLTPQELADRRVAMNIFLTPATRPAPGGASAASTPPPFSSSFVSPSEARPRAEALSIKDVEIALSAVNAEGVSHNAVPGRRDAWEIGASVTADQFRSFLNYLRDAGILPGATVVGEAPDKLSASHAPSLTTNRYEIMRGKQWTRPPLVLAPEPATGSSRKPATPAPRLEIKIRIEQVSR